MRGGIGFAKAGDGGLTLRLVEPAIDAAAAQGTFRFTHSVFECGVSLLQLVEGHRPWNSISGSSYMERLDQWTSPGPYMFFCQASLPVPPLGYEPLCDAYIVHETCRLLNGGVKHEDGDRWILGAGSRSAFSGTR